MLLERYGALGGCMTLGNVTTIMGEDGEPQLVSRVPVTIAVK